MNDETGRALAEIQQFSFVGPLPCATRPAMLWCFHGDRGHIVQGLPLPQPEGGRRLIVLTVDEVLLLDGSDRIAATLKVQTSS